MSSKEDIRSQYLVSKVMKTYIKEKKYQNKKKINNNKAKTNKEVIDCKIIVTERRLNNLADHFES